MTTETPTSPRSAHRPATAAPGAALASAPADEVDLAVGLRALQRLWWVVLASVVVFAAAGLAISSSSAKVFEANAVINLGQPVTPNGNIVPIVTSNAADQIEFAKGDTAVAAAAAAAHVGRARIRGEIVAVALTPPLASKQVTPPAEIKLTVRDRSQAVAQHAADAITKLIIANTSDYANKEIRSLNLQVTDLNSSLTDLTRQSALTTAQIKTASPASQISLAIVQGQIARDRAQAQSDLATAQGNLALIQEMAVPSVQSAPNASLASSHSRRATVTMAALVGLIVGLAIAWSLGRRRKPAVGVSAPTVD
jgi:hypothetical protein